MGRGSLLGSRQRPGLLFRLIISVAVVMVSFALLLFNWFITNYAANLQLVQQQSTMYSMQNLLVAHPRTLHQSDHEQIRQLFLDILSSQSHVGEIEWDNGRGDKLELTSPRQQTLSPGWFNQLLDIQPQVFGEIVPGEDNQAARLSFSSNPVVILDELWKKFLQLLVSTIAGILLVLGIIMSLLYRGVTTLREMDDVCGKAIAGDYDCTVVERGPGEIRNAAAGVNKLVSYIHSTFDEVNRSHSQVIEQLHFTAELFRTIPVPVYYLDRQGMIIGVNPAWERFFSVSEQQVDGRSLQEVFSSNPGFTALVKRHQELLTDSISSVTGECEFIKNDRQTAQLLLNHARFTHADGSHAGVIGIVTDLSELKSVQDRVNQAMHDKQAAESANRAKSSFLANMSHEIRTPLTSIIGFAEMLLDSRVEMKERIDAIHTIIRAGKHLHSVINDILDISKVEAERLDLEIIDAHPYELIEDVCLLARQQAEDKGIVFSVDYRLPIPDRIHTDPTRFKQILINITNNAVKFTEQGRVEMSVEFLEDEHKLKVTISDTGIGISEEKLAHLFNPFTQVDASTTRRYGGTGLGLFLSRQLAERLGGKIEASSQLGEGSVFTITLDIGEVPGVQWLDTLPQAENDDAIEQYYYQPLSGKVLLAEDNLDTQKLVRIYLQNLGAVVTVVDDGKQAVEAATQQEYDLILMDMQMPVMDGLQAVNTLRKNNYTQPIVMLTANVMKSEVNQCMQAGCDDFLGKPINQKQFAAMVASYLHHDESASVFPAIESRLKNQNPALDVLIQQFVARFGSTLDYLQSKFKQGDMEAVKSEAHKLKGSGGSYGFPEISEAAARLEFEVIKNDMAAIEHSLQEMQRLNRGIQLARKEHQAKLAAALDKDQATI